MSQHDQPPIEPGQPDPGEDDGLIRGQVRHQQVSARVPESVGRGVFSTGAIILMGNSEFIIDFVLRMQRPHHVVARVIVPHAVMPQLTAALEQNLVKFEERFGTPPDMPKGGGGGGDGGAKPSIEEVYDDLKLPDEDLAGRYSNAVMISHSPAEFCFDFIANFFPRSAVSARVFMSAPQVPRFLDALRNTYKEFQKRVTANRLQQMHQLRQQLPGTTLTPRTGPEAAPQQPLTNMTSPYYTPPDIKPPAPPSASTDSANPDVVDRRPDADKPADDHDHPDRPSDKNADQG